MIINPAITLSILIISMIFITWLTAVSISQEKRALLPKGGEKTYTIFTMGYNIDICHPLCDRHPHVKNPERIPGRG